jgi:prepilin-type N-terminal cleavage/methylation domain-containing protein
MRLRSTPESGFTLVELLMVIAIMAVLLTLATPQFNRMQQKATIEKEVTTIYSTLASVRLQALYSKTPRTVTFSGKQMNIFPANDTTATPLERVPLPYPVSASTSVDFDASGMMLAGDRSICVDPTGAMGNNAGNTDSVVVGMAKTYMGKRQSGGACDKDHVDQK